MRMFKVTEDSRFTDLSRELLRARLSAGQVDRARESLQALNPHVDLKKVRAGDVLLVPEAPHFKTSATEPVHGQALEQFEELVRTGLADASERLRAGNEARAAERAEVASTLKSAVVKRAVGDDRELSEQLVQVMKELKEQDREDGERRGTVNDVGKAALAALATLGKLLG
jgi:hypothetical protein